ARATGPQQLSGEQRPARAAADDRHHRAKVSCVYKVDRHLREYAAAFRIAPVSATLASHNRDARSGPPTRSASAFRTSAHGAHGSTARFTAGVEPRAPSIVNANALDCRPRPVSLNEPTDAHLIERWQRRGDDAAREALVHRYRGLVRALAARYVNWGEPFDDLVQVAWIGLLKAIERYDSDRGVQFPTYATPTIVGEIRRYYRDRAWAVHVPRSVQELRVRVNATIDQWSAEHGEAPTTAELAQFLDVSPDAVLDAIHSENARSALTLPSGEDDRTASGFDVPTEERGFDQVDASLLLAGGLDSLAERERQIVAMRFEEGLTQSQIAARIGISQMHVSRLLRRALAQLRSSVGEEPDEDDR